MHKKRLLKNLLVCIVCLFTSHYLQAQSQNKEASIYRNFSAEKSKATSAKYFICKASFSQLHHYASTGSLIIERRLSDSLFIVSLKDESLKMSTQLALQPGNDNWKLSPTLLPNVVSGKQIFPASYLLTVNDIVEFESWLIAHSMDYTTAAKNTFRLKIKDAASFAEILSLECIRFISSYNTSPQPELQINSLDLSANSIDLLHSKLPALNGDSLIVSIKENIPDTDDIDLKGRYITNTLAADEITPHATIMATMVAGAGNSWYLGQGVAKAASITSSDFVNLLPDDNGNYLQYKISVQNHSYGVGVENFYGADAAAYDESALENDKLLFVFSAGNSGAVTPSTGNYAGIDGVANLTGSFKMAKNIITVGAIDSFNNVVGPSSRGPAYDGRVKPEMVAYGEDGSSGSAALVSGTALLLQQAYKNNNGGVLPSSSLLKAALLNSCDDIESPGIDFTSGYGNLNAYKAVQEINDHQYFTGNVSNAATQNFSISIPANISKAKITLVWNDAPANANAFTALINDLDLKVKENASGTAWLPWVLNSSADKDSLILLPIRKRDSLNNIEQVTIDNPVAGNYTISVNGFDISTASQNFSIAYQFDTANSFYWKFPSRNDNIFSAAANLIRWGSTFSSGTGSIDYSINNGSTWKNIATNVNLAAGYTSWNAPDTAVLALLRISIGARQFVSDTFTISDKPDIKVGFNCKDSVLLFWDKIKGINNYQVYSLGAKYLQPIAIVADTQFVFNKNNLPAQQFAVAPVIKNKNAVKSYTINYTTQGVDCYISNLLADLINDNNARLQLSIGTTYLISKIVFQKLESNTYTTLQEITNINGLDYAVTDVSLHKGQNSYRVAIYLRNGKIIYSDLVSVLYFKNDTVIIYPNPVINGNSIFIELKDLNNQVITLADITGRVVFQKISSSTEFILPANFVKGVYILTVYDAVNKTRNIFKVMVL
ncbi:MAG: S8 family serine peptidase [Ferruginibacter sp.]